MQFLIEIIQILVKLGMDPTTERVFKVSLSTLSIKEHTSLPRDYPADCFCSFLSIVIIY